MVVFYLLRLQILQRYTLDSKNLMILALHFLVIAGERLWKRHWDFLFMDGNFAIKTDQFQHTNFIFYRSGDKSSDCNVGFFVRNDDEWDWLRSTLSTATIKDLLEEEYRGGQIDRFEIPNLVRLL